MTSELIGSLPAKIEHIENMELEWYLSAAWLLPAAAFVLLAVGRRHLPIGVCEGLFVTALSGLLINNFTALSESSEWTFWLAASLVALTFFWWLVVVWIEREAEPPATNGTVERQAVRRGIALHAVTGAGLLGTAAVWHVCGTAAVPTLGLLLLLGLLLTVAAGLYFRQHSALSRSAVIALLLVTLLGLTIRLETPAARRLTISLFLLAGAAATLITVLAAVLADWRRRVRIWKTDPDRLTNPLPTRRRLYGLIAAACVLVGIGGVLLADAWPTPLATVLAAYACLTVGHCRRSNTLGELGLALVGGSIIAAALAWLPASPANGLLGTALAGVFLLWLARFWHQQLNDGRPWTTTGRLIPAARHLSYAAAGGQCVLAAFWALAPVEPPMHGGWQAIVAALLMLLHWSLLVREARVRRSSTAASLACFVLLAALVPVYAITAGGLTFLTPGLLAAVAGLALVFRVGRATKVDETTWVYNAYLGGVIPLAAVYEMTSRGNWMAHWPAAIAAGLCLALVVALRWRITQPRGKGP
ncbi:MAG: hypothetical protein KAY37_15375 [Phycisphaerae bacterium]|nr:hypothetical protein [Phycisphaerae bacterium]